jgi:hypothetical protein
MMAAVKRAKKVSMTLMLVCSNGYLKQHQQQCQGSVYDAQVIQYVGMAAAVALAAAVLRALCQ